jgi:hypothetical protein
MYLSMNSSQVKALKGLMIFNTIRVYEVNSGDVLLIFFARLQEKLLFGSIEDWREVFIVEIQRFQLDVGDHQIVIGVLSTDNPRNRLLSLPLWGARAWLWSLGLAFSTKN